MKNDLKIKKYIYILIYTMENNKMENNTMENNTKVHKSSEAHIRASKKYVEKVKGTEAYILSRKNTNQKYYQKRKEYYEKYREMLQNGLIKDPTSS